MTITARSGRKTVKLASGRFTLHKQGFAKLAVKLSRAGKKLLRAHHGHVKVTVAVAVPVNGKMQTVTRQIKLK